MALPFFEKNLYKITTISFLIKNILTKKMKVEIIILIQLN